MKFADLKYERINLEETSAQLTELLDQFEAAKNTDQFLEIFKEIEKIDCHVETMETLSTIRHSINTLDEFYNTEEEWWNDNSPKLQAFSTRLAKIVLDFEDRDGLLSYIPETYFQLAQCNIKSFDEKCIPLMIEENKLSTEYEKLKASAQIELDGKIYNLASIWPLCESDDRDLRKRAYDAKMKFYEDNEAEFDRIYDEMVKVRTEMARQMGYENYVELGYYRMCRLDYNQEMVANYRRQVKEDIVPIVNKLAERQRKRLGLDDLTYYDFSYQFANGNPKPKGSTEELVAAAVKMYHEMSPQTGEFIDIMNDNELWDLVSRDGKELGGYCASIDEYKVPFIFSNFNGTADDVDTLTHEAGHAFMYYCAQDIPVTNCVWPTMESAEIHSMSMEFFAYPWMEDFFKEDTQKYYFSHLSGAIKFLPYGVLVDHFQHEVYNHPEMSPAERKACWRQLEKEYMPSKKYEGCDILERGCWWYQQGHIFSSPFYYIDYTLAQVCALQFWARMQEKDPNAFSDYLHLCSLGGTLSFTKLVKEANLIVPFEDGCLKDIAVEAEKFLDSFDDSTM